MKKQPSKELIGTRVAGAPTTDKTKTPKNMLRKKGEAKHTQGYHELIPEHVKHVEGQHVPQLKQKP